MARRRAGLRFHGTKRKQVAPWVKVNYNPVVLLVRLFQAIADGPGGKTLRDAWARSVSWTIGPNGAHWNSRTDRVTADTPGFGSVSYPAGLRSRRRPAARQRSR